MFRTAYLDDFVLRPAIQLSKGPFSVGLAGFEPATPRLSSVCSNQLSYRPVGQSLKADSEEKRVLTSLSVQGRSPGHGLQKGGDPTAGSPTVTLLRLHPSHQPLLGDRPPSRVGQATSGATDSHGVTGGVYKARERIHRGVLIRDY